MNEPIVRLPLKRNPQASKPPGCPTCGGWQAFITIDQDYLAVCLKCKVKRRASVNLFLKWEVLPPATARCTLEIISEFKAL
jgi:hypothetical protein